MQIKISLSPQALTTAISDYLRKNEHSPSVVVLPLKEGITVELSTSLQRMIDPPNGHRYGFPKPFPETSIPTKEWLVKNGYPQGEIDALGSQFYVRMFYDGPAA